MQIEPSALCHKLFGEQRMNPLPILPLKVVQAKHGAIVLLAAKRDKKTTLSWLIHLGGPSLILLGLLDNSIIPLPGSMDVVTILLAAHRREPWIYYSIMATLGAILGGYITYHMAPQGGKRSAGKTVPKEKSR